MSTDWRIGKEKVAHTYNGILFSLKKDGNPVIYLNVDKPWGYCAKWNKLVKTRRFVCISTLYEASEAPKLLTRKKQNGSGQDCRAHWTQSFSLWEVLKIWACNRHHCIHFKIVTMVSTMSVFFSTIKNQNRTWEGLMAHWTVKILAPNQTQVKIMMTSERNLPECSSDAPISLLSAWDSCVPRRDISSGS
jgi:hypothetical protein